MEISFEDVKSTGKWLLIVCGGFTIIIPAIITFLAQKLSDYKNEKWRLNTEVKLKNLENELSQKTSLINNMIEVQKSNYSLSQEKRIFYIEEIWGLISELNYILPDCMDVFDNSDDYLLSLSNFSGSSEEFENIKEELDELDNEEYINSYVRIQKRLSAARPFLGEDLHQTFYTLYVFYTRVFSHLLNGVKAELITHWTQDPRISKVLKDALKDDEYKFINDKRQRNLTYITGILEGKIIEQINLVLSGNVATKTSIEHVKEITELMDLSSNKTTP